MASLDESGTRSNQNRLSAAFGAALVVLVVGGLAFALLLVADTWRVNPDGSAYISLASALIGGHGYTFPDGSYATFRGPGYPALIAAAFVVFEATARTAIWVSRAALAVNALLLAGIALLTTQRKLWAMGAGLLAAASPLVFESGASQLVPDGFAMTWILLAVIVVMLNYPATTRGFFLRSLAAGFLVGLSFATKETSILALPIVWAAIAATGDSASSKVRGAALAAAGVIGVVFMWMGTVMVWTGSLPVPLAGLDSPAALLALGSLVAAALLLGIFAAIYAAPPRRSERTFSVPSVVGILLAYSAVVYAVLLAAGGETVMSLGAVPRSLLEDIRQQLYSGVSLATGIIVVSVAILVMIALWMAKPAELLVGLALLAFGLGSLLNAVQRNFGPRNGVAFSYGVALIAGVAIAAVNTRPRSWRSLVVGGVALIASGSILVVDTVSVVSRSDARTATAAFMSWDGPVVDNTATWLARNASDENVVGTFYFMSAIGSRVRDDLSISMAPMYGAVPSTPRLDDLEFDRVNWWAAPVPADPSFANDKVIGLTSSDRLSGAILERELLKYLEESAARFLVVTGNVFTYPTNTFDATILVPYLDSSPSFIRRYTEGTSGGSQWAIVYEVLSLESSTVAPTWITPTAADLFSSPEDGRDFRVLHREDLLQVLDR